MVTIMQMTKQNFRATGLTEEQTEYTHSLCEAARLASWGRAQGSRSQWRCFPGSGGTLHRWTPSEAQGYSARFQLGGPVKGRGKWYRSWMRYKLQKLVYKGSKTAEKSFKCWCGLTQESWVSVTQRKALVTRNTEGRQHVETLVQERLKAGGRGISWMEQVINLLTGRTQGGHWRGEGNTVRV